MKARRAAVSRSRISRSYSRPCSAGPMASSVAAPAMAPASTNGVRLFGRATTSAGTSSSIASMAAVEFTVTITSAIVVRAPRSTAGGDIRTCRAPPAAWRYGSTPSAGCGLTTSSTSGIAAAAPTSEAKAGAICVNFEATRTTRVAGTRSWRGARSPQLHRWRPVPPLRAPQRCPARTSYARAARARAHWPIARTCSEVRDRRSRRTRSRVALTGSADARREHEDGRDETVASRSMFRNSGAAAMQPPPPSSAPGSPAPDPLRGARSAPVSRPCRCTAPSHNRTAR